MTLPSRISLLTLCLSLAACSTPPTPESGIGAPHAWQGEVEPSSTPLPSTQWWRAFASNELDRLVERARLNAYDLAAATARVRQAQAQAVIAGAPLLPELNLGLDGSRQRLLHGKGNDQLDVSSNERTSTSFDLKLSASYEIDFWGGLRAARASALSSLDASRFEVAGRLSIKGVGSDVVVPVTLARQGAQTVATGAFPIRRLQFRIGENEWADTAMVADEVQVKFRLVLTGVAPL